MRDSKDSKHKVDERVFYLIPFFLLMLVIVLGVFAFVRENVPMMYDYEVNNGLGGVVSGPATPQAITVTQQAVTTVPFASETPIKNVEQKEDKEKSVVYDILYENKIKESVNAFSKVNIYNITETSDINNNEEITRTGGIGEGDYTVDVKNSRLKAELKVFSGVTGVVKQDTYKLLIDYKKNKFFTKLNDKKWKGLKKKGIRVYLYKKGDTIFDIYKKIFSEKGKIKGTSTSSIDTFIYERKARKDDLVGIEYNDLKLGTLRFEVKVNKKTSLPISIEISVAYGKKKVTDTLKNTWIFQDYSKKSLILEKVKV